MNRKKQVLVIHGGTTFPSTREYIHFLKSSSLELKKLRLRKDWKDSLQDKLGESFDVLHPRMPNATNAFYEEWKIYFDKIISLLDDGTVFVGHSLGALFLIKYLSENFVSKKIDSLFLVAAPFDSGGSEETLGSFAWTTKMNGLKKQVNKIYFYFSKDDEAVPFLHAKLYKEILPLASVKTFEDRGHFNQEEFPELVQDIKDLN